PSPPAIIKSIKTWPIASCSLRNIASLAPKLFYRYNREGVNIMQLNQPYAFHHPRLRPYSSYFPLCNLIITLVPFPNSLCTSILPPCDSTISFEMASPSPEPPFSLDRDFSTRYNRSNIYGSFFLGIPFPSSVKVMLFCLAVCLTSTLISISSLSSSSALSSIFVFTRCILSVSIKIFYSFAQFTLF